MTKNKESTRYFSDIQEKSVCRLLDAVQQSNSGAGKFSKIFKLSKILMLNLSDRRTKKYVT